MTRSRSRASFVARLLGPMWPTAAVRGTRLRRDLSAENEVHGGKSSVRIVASRVQEGS
jgi:hypothetical protein